MTYKQFIIFIFIYMFISPLVMDFMTGVYTGLGWIEE